MKGIVLAALALTCCQPMSWWQGSSAARTASRSDPPPVASASNRAGADPPPPVAPTSAGQSPAGSDPAVEGEDAIDDDVPDLQTSYDVESAPPPPHPLDGLDDKTLEKLLVDDPERLGSMSVGRPNGGALVNGVQLQPDDHFVLADPAHTWGTEETVHYLHVAADEVWRQFPDSPKLYIGHISARHGGHLQPHVSHQCGRDVDVGFFYLDGSHWYRRGTRDNLDLPRTWAFVRAIIAHTDVKMILLDRRIQKLLRDYALSIGEDPAWLDSVFRGVPGHAPPIIRYAPGHGTHMHVRFYNPIAQQTARRMYPMLVAHHIVRPGTYYILHRVKRGETLGKLSRRYGVSVRAIRRANHLHSNLIRANVSYKIPRTGMRIASMPPLVLPPRRVPPPRKSVDPPAR